MPGNTTSLYSSTGSSATVSGTNTSGLYGGTGSYVVGTAAYGNVNVAAFLQSYTGNLQAGNATILGNLAADGVLTDNYYYANGAPISFAGTYSNANVANYLPIYSGNLAAGNAAISGEITAATVSTTGNITGDYILGNGSQLTGLPQQYGNANVSAFLPTYTGNLQAGNLEVINDGNINNDLYVGGTIYGTFSGNISGNLVVPGVNTDVIFNNAGNAGASSDFQFNDATNVLTVNGTANVNTLNATGNITGSYFIGNGSQLTGLPASYSNANVATFLANFGSNVISTTGNITGGNIIANGQFLTNLPGANVTGTVANAAYATAAGTADYVTQANQSNITSVGNLTSLTVTGDAVIGGNLEVDGNVTYIASNVVTINDKFINVANNAATASQADGGGIGVGPIGSEYATWTFDNGNTTWDSNLGVAAPSFSATGNVTGQYIIGDGSLLTNINAGNITGAYGNANVANYLPTFTGNLAGNNLNLTGNIEADYANVIVTYPYQFDIQGIGNATQVTTILGSGININPDAANFGINMFCDTANAAIDIGQSTANATGAINIGGFGGATPNINIGGFNGYTANVNVVSANLSTGNILATGAVSATGNITGSYILGNGSQLTGLPATYGNANVSNFLANGFGSNNITTSGNVSFGNINVTGTITSTTGAVKIPDDVELGGGPVIISGTLGTFTTAANTSGYAANIFNSDSGGSGLKIQAGATSSQVLLDLVNVYGVSIANIIPGFGMNITGVVKAGNVQYTNQDGTAGQVLATHGNGVTYFATAPAGSLTGNMTGNISGVNLYNISGLTSLSATSVATDTISSPSGDFVNIEGVISGAGLQSSGNAIFYNQKGISFQELQTNGSSVVFIRAPEALSQDYIYQLPNSYGTANQALLTDGTGNMTWGSALTGNMAGNISGVSLYNISGLTSLSASSVATDTISSPSGDFVTIEGVIATNGGQMSGNLVFNNQQGVILREQTSSGTNYVQLKSYPSLSTDTIYLLPNDGANGQVLTTSGTGNLSWTTVSGGASSNSFSTIAANGTNIVAASSTDTLTITAGTNITITGNAATDTITISAAGGSGTPGGSDTQVQYNNGGAFGGMGNVTYTDTGANTGDLALGNVIFATDNTNTNSNNQTFNNWIKNANDHIGNSATAGTYTPGRYLFGKGLGGTPGSGGVPGYFGVNVDQDGSLRNARVAIADRYTLTDTGVRNCGLMVYNWVDVSGNINSANTNTRVQGIVSALNIGGNGAGNLVSTSTNPYRGFNAAINIGTTANANVGNTIATTIVGYNSFINVNSGSELKNAVHYVATGSSASGSTTGNSFGLVHNFSSSVAYSKIALVNMQNSSGNGWGQNSTLPTTYLFLDNTDTRSSSLVGPIKEYYDRPYTFTTTTGSTNLDWNNGTAQYLKPTGNVTLAFANALTSSNGNLFHTVTLVVEQGTTPYTITLPTANATIKYAGGVSTPGATANAVVMITSTAANINGSTTYLTTVSPEFL